MPLCAGCLQHLSRGMMQDSVDCAGPQQHSGESPVFIHCMVLKIELSFLIPSSKASHLLQAGGGRRGRRSNSVVLVLSGSVLS